MTVGLAAAVANSWLDTDLDDLFVKLHTGDPGAAGTANAAVGDATRKQYTTPAASGGVKTATATGGVVAGPWTNGGTSETLTHISIWTLVSGGVFKLSAALSASQAWVSTNTFNLTSLVISVTPIAA